MTNLIMPLDGSRVPPLAPSRVNAYVRSEYDKTVHTWGIPNNLVRTMAWLPGLALTEVDYANSFIFDEGTYLQWPRPGKDDPSDTVLFPSSGFIDRVTKELVINLVSLLNRSRYSITHHTVIGYTTLCRILPFPDQKVREAVAEEMFYHLADGSARPAFENRMYDGQPLYDDFQVLALRLAVKLQGDAHSVSDAEFDALKSEMRKLAQHRIQSGILADQAAAHPDGYVEAYVNGMLIELTWCIVHFAGLLNKWFTVLKVMEESDEKRDGIDFVAFYNSTIPERIKVRNNTILGTDGWGGLAKA